MTEMFGEAWSPMSVPYLAPDDDDVHWVCGGGSGGVIICVAVAVTILSITVYT